MDNFRVRLECEWYARIGQQTRYTRIQVSSYVTQKNLLSAKERKSNKNRSHEK